MRTNLCVLIMCSLFQSSPIHAQKKFQHKNCKFYTALMSFEHQHPNRSSFDSVDWEGLANLNFIPHPQPNDSSSIHWLPLQQFDLSHWIKSNNALVKNITHGFMSCPSGARIQSWDERSNRYHLDHYQLKSLGPSIDYSYNKKTKKRVADKANYTCVYLSPLEVSRLDRHISQKKIECHVELISVERYPLPPAQ